MERRLPIKLFLNRRFNRSVSCATDSRPSIDSFDSNEYVIQLPVSLIPKLASQSVTPQAGSLQRAQMMDEEDCAWGRPSKKNQGRRH
ncbi:hypothetical protein BKA93DRAFT_538336 [Sparassis latifolia]